MKTNVQMNGVIDSVLWSQDVIRNLANRTFEIAQRDVEESEFSAKKIKSLTSDIMHDVSVQDNTKLMLTIAKRVELWKNDETKPWKSVLKTYARQYENIKAIYVGKGDLGTEFVIVVNNVIMDEVLDYNDFCFELMEDYNSIADFYVFDEDEYESMITEYANYKKIYQRG